MRYFTILQSLFAIIFMVGLTTCKDTEMAYNPCLSPKRIAFIKPGFPSIDWMPYFGRPNIVFKGPMDALSFMVQELQILMENPQDSFFITCIEDSQQKQIVYYSTGTYSTLLVNSDPQSDIQYFNIEAVNIIDEPYSDYETIRIADLLSIHVGLKQANGTIVDFEILRFTLAKNNFISPLPNVNVIPVLRIGNRTYEQVYYNQVDIEDITLYYNQNQGLLGFTYKKVMYTLP